jgi:hypothetical protein
MRKLGGPETESPIGLRAARFLAGLAASSSAEGTAVHGSRSVPRFGYDQRASRHGSERGAPFARGCRTDQRTDTARRPSGRTSRAAQSAIARAVSAGRAGGLIGPMILSLLNCRRWRSTAPVAPSESSARQTRRTRATPLSSRVGLEPESPSSEDALRGCPFSPGPELHLRWLIIGLPAQVLPAARRWRQHLGRGGIVHRGC